MKFICFSALIWSSCSQLAVAWVRATARTASPRLWARPPNGATAETLASHDDLTGEVLGEKYLLCKDAKESTSGKSSIIKAYPMCGDTKQPNGDQIVLKVSNNVEALER